MLQFVLDGLIRLANWGRIEEAKACIRSAPDPAPFEPLLLALEALSDRKVLRALAPERRTLVLEVMEKLAG